MVSDASASPYMGDVSTSRLPDSIAAETTSRASAESPPNVPDVPRPTTGPSFRSSIIEYSARDPAGGVSGGEERRIVVGPSPHVRERQAVARLAPAFRVGLVGDRHLAKTQREHGLRVVRQAAVALALVRLRHARGDNRLPAERRRGVRRLGRRKPSVPEPRSRADDAGADRAHDGVEPGCLRPGEGRCR